MRKEDTFTKDYMKEHTGAVDTKNVAPSYEVQKIMHEQDDLEDTNRPNDDQNKKTITESKGNSAEKLLEKNAWHPGFVAAASLELRNEKNLLLIPERNLSKEPLRIDLFIQNGGQRIIQNEIGHLF